MFRGQAAKLSMRPKLQPFANAAANCDSMCFCESRTCDPSQVTCLRTTSMRVGTAAFVLLQPSHAFALAGSLLAAGLVVLLPRVLSNCGSCGCPTPTRAHLQILDWSCTSLHSLSPANSASSAPTVLLLRASPAARSLHPDTAILCSLTSCLDQERRVLEPCIAVHFCSQYRFSPRSHRQLQQGVNRPGQLSSNSSRFTIQDAFCCSVLPCSALSQHWA